jgi:hypothetical protein
MNPFSSTAAASRLTVLSQGAKKLKPLKHLLYLDRTCRKLDTYMRIIWEMPATFSVLQERTGKSPSLLDAYLKYLVKINLVRKERNLYRFNDGVLKDDWMKKAPFKERVLLAIMYEVPLKFRVEGQIREFNLYEALEREELADKVDPKKV